MRFARLVRQTARIAVASFAATSAGVIGAALVPSLLLDLPLKFLLTPPKPLLVFALSCVGIFGIPIFVIASSQRQKGLGILSYVGYSVAIAVMVVMLVTFSGVNLNSFSGTKFYDSMWILLTEAIPGGVFAGLVAYSAMTVGEAYEAVIESHRARNSPRPSH